DGNVKFYPASYRLDNVVSVMATDGTDKPIAPGGLLGTNAGCDSVHIAAPGIGIVTLGRLSGYPLEKGTSFAAPFVTATAALINSMHQGAMAPVAVRQKIMDSATRACLKNVSKGRLNMHNALQ